MSPSFLTVCQNMMSFHGSNIYYFMFCFSFATIVALEAFCNSCSVCSHSSIPLLSHFSELFCCCCCCCCCCWPNLFSSLPFARKKIFYFAKKGTNWSTFFPHPFHSNANFFREIIITIFVCLFQELLKICTAPSCIHCATTYTVH